MNQPLNFRLEGWRNLFFVGVWVLKIATFWGVRILRVVVNWFVLISEKNWYKKSGPGIGGQFKKGSDLQFCAFRIRLYFHLSFLKQMTWSSWNCWRWCLKPSQLETITSINDHLRNMRFTLFYVVFHFFHVNASYVQRRQTVISGPIANPQNLVVWKSFEGNIAVQGLWGLCLSWFSQSFLQLFSRIKWSGSQGSKLLVPNSWFETCC